MTTMQDHLTPQCMWAHQTFQLLHPSVQRDTERTRTKIRDAGIALGWDGARLDAAVLYAVAESEDLQAAEAGQTAAVMDMLQAQNGLG